MELKGTGVSPGIATGLALVVEREAVPVFRLSLPAERVEPEVARLSRAAETSRSQLQAIKERLSREVGAPHAYIFDAQLLMLEDPLLLERAAAMIRAEAVNAEWALRDVAERLHALFEGFKDEYLRERSSDLDDVVGRILLNLEGGKDAPSLAHLPGSFILVAPDLPPSETAELDWERIAGVALETGSATSHTAIVARSRGIPVVVGLREVTRRIPPGAAVVLDGSEGRVVVDPSEPVLAGFRAAREREVREETRLRQTRGLAAVTRDGVGVRLQANLEFPDEAATAVVYGAEGIGLFRSEYLLGRARVPPGEERQVEIYRRLLEQMDGRPVTIRLWDLGPEDLSPGGPSSPNPALGPRALRLLGRSEGAYRQQARALLRVAAEGALRMLLPFVGGVAELREIRRFLSDVREELGREGVAVPREVPLGLNLEVPGAALTADLLAPEVDFFSVGTNDLIQYLLAVDRTDPRVAPLHQPLHPGVLRLLRTVVEAAERTGTPLSVCGEMAAEPSLALVLVGLGVRDLSMRPAAIPRVKALIRSVEAAWAREIAMDCLGLPTAEDVEARLRRELVNIHAAV